jgi:hypothetical protein
MNGERLSTAEEAVDREGYPCTDAVGKGSRERVMEGTPALPCRKRPTPVTPRFETSETQRVTLTLQVFCDFPSSYNMQLRDLGAPTRW